MHVLWQLFSSFFKVGAFTIGGGYAMLPVMRRDIVERLGWLEDDEFTETIAVTQSAPGAIAVNTAIFIGNKQAGIPGALAGCLGVILPSFMIILSIAVFFTNILEWEPAVKFFAGVRPAVVALIAHVAWKMARKLVRGRFFIALFAVALAAIVLLPGVHPVIFIIASGLVTLAWAALNKNGGEQ
ncbi:MAG: chromate transporter [Firmicutes bacterium]|nr:chromate transporter [Bacillota bacterium]